MEEKIKVIRPFFSVIVPVYNKGPHISRTINSILNQSFKDYELIIIDDASTDNSLEEIKKYKDKRIKLLRRDKPGPGGYAARNYGISVSQGKWITFLDADDEWYSEHLANSYKYLIEFENGFIAACGWQIEYDGIRINNSFYEENKHQPKKIINLIDYFKSCIKNQQPIFTDVAFIKRDCPILENIFPAEMDIKTSGDLYTWIKLICFHKEMLWFNNLGAIYHQNTINQVTTQTVINSLELWSKDSISTLKINLTVLEQKYLVKYINYLLYNFWKRSSILDKPRFILRDYLIWENSKFNTFKYFILSFTPQILIKFLFSIKQYYKKIKIMFSEKFYLL